MPALAITDSPNISSLDFAAEFDIPNLTLTVNLVPSVWIGTGYNNVLGAKFTVTSPFGLVLPNPTAATYDITPPNLNTTDEVAFTLPQSFSAVEWGVYKIKVVLTDADGDTYEWTKPLDVCRPKQTGLEVNTSNASMNLKLDIKIRDGIGIAYDNTVYSYKSVEPTAKVYANSIYFDSTLGLSAITSAVQPPIQFNLYTGKITYKATDTVTYATGDNFTVILKYVGSVSKEVSTIDFCKAYCCLADKTELAKSYAGTNKEVQLKNEVEQAAVLLLRMELGIDCGFDVSGLIEEFFTLTGCDCSCDCNGAVSPSPASITANAVVVQGTGNNTVSQSTAGVTTTFVVNGKTYSIKYGGSQATPEITINTAVVGNDVVTSLSLNIPQLATYLQPYISAGGILCENVTATYIPNNTVETTIYTCTLDGATATNVPYNTLSKDGDIIRGKVLFQNNNAALGGNRTIRFKFAGATFQTMTIPANSTEWVTYEFEIIRVTVNTQQINIQWMQGNVLSTMSWFVFVNTGAANLAVANSIVVTGQNATAVASSLQFLGFFIEIVKKI